MGLGWIPVMVLILPLVIQASSAADGYCDATQDKVQCYGALGGTIEIKLGDSFSETPRIIWRKDKQKFFEWKNLSVIMNTMKNRSIVNDSNGTYKLKHLSGSDSGNYTLDIYNSPSRLTKQLTQRLFIEAPVSSVRLEHQCLSKGELRVNCTSLGGDSPEYSWTLNGQNVSDSQLLSINTGGNSITLRQDTQGLLVCSVKNNVSQVQKEWNISSCGYIFINCTINGTEVSDWVINNTQCSEPTAPTLSTFTGKTPSTYQSIEDSSQTDSWYSNYWPILAGVLVTVVLAAVGAAICVLKKTCKNRRDDFVDELEEDLTYADVRTLQQPGRRLQETPEMDAEYSQVKFSKESPQISVTVDDVCIYAKVKVTR